MPAAAVVREIANEIIHVVEVGAVDHKAAVLPAARQSRTRQMCQVEGKRRGRQVELLANQPGGQALRACLNEKPEDLQPSFVGQGDSASIA